MEFYIQWWAHFSELIDTHIEKKNWFVPAWEVNFLKKLPRLVALQIFQIEAYILSCGESLNHNIFSHNY